MSYEFGNDKFNLRFEKSTGAVKGVLHKKGTWGQWAKELVR